MSKTWRPLKKGDRVVAVAPGLPYSYRDDATRVGKMREMFAAWDLELAIMDGEDKDYYGWLNSPEVRANQIIQALQDPTIKVMFIYGGSMSEEVIEILRKRKDELPIRNDMLAIGFSDGDQILNFLGQELGIVSPVEGPPIGAFSADEKDKQAMHDFLFEQKLPKTSLRCCNDAARSAKEIDGKMVMFSANDRRSSYRALIDENYGSILLLEAGQGGRGSKDGLEFVLRTIAGQKERPSAIVLSICEIGNFDEIAAVIKDLDIPVFIGAPFGHAKLESFTPLPLHSESKISVNGDEVSLVIAPARSLENVEEVKALCAKRKAYKNPDVAEVKSATLNFDEALIVRPIYEASKKPDSSDLSWVERVTPQKSKEREFVFSRAVRNYRKYDASDLDGFDLTGKDLMIDLSISLPPFDIWKKSTDGRPEKSLEDYNKTYLSALVSTAGGVLLELHKTGQLQKSNSVILMNSAEIPPQFNDWLEDFAKRNCPDQNFYTAQTPEFFHKEGLISGPPKEKGEITRVRLPFEISREQQLVY